MDLKEEELKYLLILLDDLTEDIFDEVLQAYDGITEEKYKVELSENVFDFFEENLKTNPVTTSFILNNFWQHLNGDQLLKVQEIYLTELKSNLDDPDKIQKLISLISVIKFDDDHIDRFIQEVLFKIPHELFGHYLKQFYISLMTHQRPAILRKCAEYIKTTMTSNTFKLTPEYVLGLCYVEKTHWLLKAVAVYKEQLLDITTVTFKINNFTKQILILVLIAIVNDQDNYDFPTVMIQLRNLLTILNYYTSNDKELEFYITEIKREYEIVKFCVENNCKLLSMSVFNQVSMQSSLLVISQLCKLGKIDRYSISRLLRTNSEYSNKLKALKTDSADTSELLDWDNVTYSSYCAITTAIDLILSCSDGEQNTDETEIALAELKRLLLSIKQTSSFLETVENIYSCLFLRYEYFSWEEYQEYHGTQSDCSYFGSKKLKPKSKNNTSSGFMCTDVTTAMILNTLKTCLDTFSVEVASADKLDDIKKLIEDSLWKLQLISSLSPEYPRARARLCVNYSDVDYSSEDDVIVDTKVKRRSKSRRKRSFKSDTEPSSPLSTNGDGSLAVPATDIEFISLMLASPNCLVALALHHNDFIKANQIIEMFDLSEAEIATEVIFTEKLRALVAKIKNVIIYKDIATHPMNELTNCSVIATEVMGLVEAFLSSNASPNSIDIIELSRRHPDLQLYNYQNASLINAIDILLSTALNREISYALINVVERKLAKVRTETAVAPKKTNYIKFIENVASVTFEIHGKSEKAFNYEDSVCKIVTDAKIPLVHKDFIKMNQLGKELKKACAEIAQLIHNYKNEDENVLQKYHQTYNNIVAISDKDICNMADCSRAINRKNRLHYLRTSYIYAKNVSLLENDQVKSSPETPYFAIFDKNLHDIIDELVHNKNVPVSSLEPICKKLNINLIHKLLLNFCPPIPLLSKHKEASEINFNNLLHLVYEFQNTDENLFVEPVEKFSSLQRPLNAQSLTYIVLNNWVLAHIVKKLHTSSMDHSLQQSMDSRTKYLNNYMDLERFNFLGSLFGGNKYLASLHSSIDLDKLFIFFAKLVEMGKIQKCLHILDSLSEDQLLTSPNLMNLRDLILFKLATHPRVESNWKYCQHLKCPDLKVNLILNNLPQWPIDGALEVLEYVKYLLDPISEDDGLYEKCDNWMARIPIYDQIAKIMGVSTWHRICEQSMERPEEIIEALMDSHQFKLCLEWADLHEVSTNVRNLIVSNLLRQLFEYTNQATPSIVKELLYRLPTSQAVDLIQENMSKIRNIDILNICINFVIDNSADLRAFENIKIGLEILLEIDLKLRQFFWDLIEKPLLMIEQFLMNAKLDKLSYIIDKISGHLKVDPAGDNLYYNIKAIEGTIISRNSVDALLRYYAEKALDMKSPRSSLTPPPKANDSLMQSIDSINIDAASRPFVMPEQVPAKEQWVQDYSTDRCMVCKISIFSMIIRRHHCRRCGRLICHACSRSRMQVPTYPQGVKYRVCDDCYAQTMGKRSGAEEPTAQSSYSESVSSAVTCMDWCLSVDGKKNEEVRGEFSYEFTPNVTLCLSIMRMHSITLDYPRFLLDRSDELCDAAAAGGSEARLLVRARRSLLLAAAELYCRSHGGGAGGAGSEVSRVAEAGAAHAARCLAHADAVATLVRHGAHHLLPRHRTMPGQFVRSLLEAERWELALELATKSGLGRNSVLAAWGKACLRAGCFQQARDKFAHCFKSSVQLAADVVDDCELGKEASETAAPAHRQMRRLRHSERSSSTSSAHSEPRGREPPLLAEIVAMLQTLSYPVNPQLLHKAEAIKATKDKLTLTSNKKIHLNEPALNIMHALASVKKIKQGDYSDFHTGNSKKQKPSLLRRSNSTNETNYKKLDPFFYKECVYYLSNYGSHAGNIAFYMAHSSLTEVLKYCYDNMVDKETFTESVYMECLKLDKVSELVKCMYEFDTTLETWSEYITGVCRALEAAGRLEALYALQTRTAQHARAAATCARLYARPLASAAAATPHAALQERAPRLAAARHHLMQCVPVAVPKPNDPKSFHMQLDRATIDKHLTTISRQMEVAKFLAGCESSGRLTDRLYKDITAAGEESTSVLRPLTLFGSNTDRTKLAALVLAAPASIEEGFGLAYKIIVENKLDSMKVYTLVVRYLVQADRCIEVKALAKCVRHSKEQGNMLMSDQLVEAGVRALVARCEARGQLYHELAELLIEDVHAVGIKITCYMECKILTDAYILAVKHDRTNDLKRILREAERLGQDQVRNACLKRLNAKNMT